MAVRSGHITGAGRDEASEILRALRFAHSSTRITHLRDRRRALAANQADAS